MHIHTCIYVNILYSRKLYYSFGGKIFTVCLHTYLAKLKQLYICHNIYMLKWLIEIFVVQSIMRPCRENTS